MRQAIKGARATNVEPFRVAALEAIFGALFMILVMLPYGKDVTEVPALGVLLMLFLGYISQSASQIMVWAQNIRLNMRSDNPYSADQVKRSLIHFIFGKGSTAIVGLALMLLVVRALPAGEYGIYIAMLAALEIIQLASNPGLIAAAYRYVPEIRSKNQGSALHQLLVRLSVFRLTTLIMAVIAIEFLISR